MLIWCERLVQRGMQNHANWCNCMISNEWAYSKKISTLPLLNGINLALTGRCWEHHDINICSAKSNFLDYCSLSNHPGLLSVVQSCATLCCVVPYLFIMALTKDTVKGPQITEYQSRVLAGSWARITFLYHPIYICSIIQCSICGIWLRIDLIEISLHLWWRNQQHLCGIEMRSASGPNFGILQPWVCIMD